MDYDKEKVLNLISAEAVREGNWQIALACTFKTSNANNPKQFFDEYIANVKMLKKMADILDVGQCP